MYSLASSARTENSESFTTNQVVWKTIQQIARLCRQKSQNTQRRELKNSKCSPPAPTVRRLGEQTRNRGHRAEQCGGPSAPRCRQQALRIHHPPPPVPYSSLDCQCNASQVRLLPLPKEQFFGWGETQHPARWNLATVCLLALTGPHKAMLYRCFEGFWCSVCRYNHFTVT